MFCSTVRSGRSDSSWKHGGDAWRARGVRIGRRERLAVDQQMRPASGAQGPGKNLDEGRFAGAVLAEEGVDLAGARREMHIVHSATMPP